MTDEEIFHLAASKPTAERSAFLAEACAGDVALQQRVQDLLDAHDNPRGFMAGSPVDHLAGNADAKLRGDAGSHAITEGPGSEIGPYKLLERSARAGWA